MSPTEQLVRVVVEACDEQNGRKTLSCARALGLAKKHGVKPAEIGDVCNANGIKIVDCQLGCFGR